MPRPLLRAVLATLIAILTSRVVDAQPFSLVGPGVDASQLRVTTFAEGLNYPVGMTELDDGSLLVGVSNGNSFFGSTSGSLLRLADTDGDGVADVQQTLTDSVPGGKLSSVSRAGDLVAVVGQGQMVPLTIYRLGQDPADPAVQVGRFDLRYPGGGWLHPHSSVRLRESPNTPGDYELYFQLGSRTNFDLTTASVALSSDLGLPRTVLAGDAMHMIQLTDGPSGLTATGHTQIATGLRNATGIAFHPVTGDLYLGDNGIDGVVNANEPTSPDEIHVVPADQLGGAIEDFGFPSTYQEYRTEVDIGSKGEPPLVNFQPLPTPDGAEGEGVNEIAFSPALFPDALANGLFAGMHGKFSQGGVANEENPLVYVDLSDNSYFHLIENTEPGVGHLDGLLPTLDTLYVADIAPGGAFNSSTVRTGKIYALASLIAPGDFNEDGAIDAADYTVWRDELGAAGLGVRGDADGDYRVTTFDYETWAATYRPSGGPFETPEPTAWMLVLGGSMVALNGQRHAQVSGRYALSVTWKLVDSR